MTANQNNNISENATSRGDQMDLEEVISKTQNVSITDIKQMESQQSEHFGKETHLETYSRFRDYHFEFVTDNASPEDVSNKSLPKTETLVVGNSISNSVSDYKNNESYEDPFKNTNIERYYSDSPYGSVTMDGSATSAPSAKKSTVSRNLSTSKTCESEKSTILNNIKIGLEALPNQRYVIT